jgi:hypothetical protein
MLELFVPQEQVLRQRTWISCTKDQARAFFEAENKMEDGRTFQFMFGALMSRG